MSGVIKSVEKAAVVGATGAGVGYAIQASGMMPDLLWPSPVGSLLGNDNGAPAFFGVVNGVSSIASDIVEEYVLPKVWGSSSALNYVASPFVGPAIAAGSAFGLLTFMSPQTLKNPYVSTPMLLGMVAAGEFAGRSLYEMILGRMMKS